MLDKVEMKNKREKTTRKGMKSDIQGVKKKRNKV